VYLTVKFSELLTSLLIRWIQMGKMSKVDWLIGLVKHTMWAVAFHKNLFHVITEVIHTNI
jgi:hypothetical protein